MIERIKKSQTKIVIASALFMAITYIPLFMNPGIVEAFVNEDMIFESLTAIYFFITCLLLGIAFFRLPPPPGDKKYFVLKKISLITLAVLFFVAAGEEISWGQRIFNIETPESIKQVNVQEELTIHNLDFFQGETATLDFSQLQTLFSLAFVFLLPLGALVIQRLLKFDLRAIVPIVPIQVGALALLNYVIQKILRNVVEVVPNLYQHSIMPFTEGLYEVREHGHAFAMMLAVFFYLLIERYSTREESRP
jgi:hypothetical protein